MANNGDKFDYVDYNLKAESPNAQFNIKKRDDGNDSHFVGFKAGVSGDVTLLKAETKLSDNVKVGCSGPSLGGNVGVRSGTENCVAAIVEPSLVKAEGQAGPIYGSVGLNATTGVKVSEEGFKAGLLGFGLTMGVGGKFTVDTPFGSIGGAKPMTQTHTRKEANLITN